MQILSLGIFKECPMVRNNYKQKKTTLINNLCMGFKNALILSKHHKGWDKTSNILCLPFPLQLQESEGQDQTSGPETFLSLCFETQVLLTLLVLSGPTPKKKQAFLRQSSFPTFSSLKFLNFSSILCHLCLFFSYFRNVHSQPALCRLILPSVANCLVN